VRIAQRVRGFFEALSRPPVHTWPDAVQHHGARIALLLLLATVTYLLYPVAPVPDLPPPVEGQVIDRDVIADVGFMVFKDDEELAAEQAEAAAAVPPIFRYDGTAVDSTRAQILTFIERVDSVVQSDMPEAAQTDALRAVLGSYSLPTSPDVVGLLEGQWREPLWLSLQGAVDQDLPTGVASNADIEQIRSSRVRILRDGSDRETARDSLHGAPYLWTLARNRLPNNAPAGLGTLQQLVLIRFMHPSLQLDAAATETARESARQAVRLIKEEVVAGQRIITAHEPLTRIQIDRLRAYQRHLARRGGVETGPAGISQVLGAFLLNLLLLSIFGFMLYFYRAAVYANFRHVLVLAGLYIFVAGISAVVAHTPAPVELVPIALPALVVAILWDGRLALYFALVLAIILSTQAPLVGLHPRIVMIAGGAAAALSVRVVQRRAQGLILGVVIAAVYALAVVALGLLLSWEPQLVLERAGFGAINGVASAIAAMGFLPLFESFTRITTDQTLLELGDLNRPLLKRLSLEASGTYAHSINVANLAEAAARAIDANPILARVGAYYHDLGKVATPQFFIENQARGRNPHDKLDPATSASIVRNHVLEGMRLAEQAKLPEQVRAFIVEHHGTQPIGFFFDRAKERNPDAELDPADYAYPGPRPQSKEAAILMLADSVESATKVLQDPTTERIRALVDRIVDTKIGYGQLDDAPLTFQDLARIKEQFVAVLNGMYHHRIDYPTVQPTADSEAAPAAGHAGAR
jgi:cyclic-di-AMP phosphodiesterase PgpH